MTKAQMTAVARHYDVPTMSTDSTFEVLQKMIKHWLPALSEMQLLEITETRLSLADEIADFLTGPDAADGMDEKDASDMKQFREKQTKKDEESKGIASQLREKKMQLVGKAGNAADHKKSGPAAAKKAKRVLPPVIDASVTEDSLNGLMPELFRVWGDTYSSRCQLFKGTSRIKAFAWNKYGYVGAGRMVLYEVWNVFKLAGNDVPAWISTDIPEGNGASSSSSGRA
mmetsp:Transcript_154171/g.493115  ORF Transcript_154171/g.493115 Transcript_154171/m.493115 type:complete len:227 (-) Transcript_154171:263-943(-)